MTANREIDWEAVELDYRAGVKTLRAIGKDHGVSHVMVQKKAKAEKWSRDLAAKIKERTDELVNKAAVTKVVTKERVVTETAIVDANAAERADIVLEERTDALRLRRAAVAMVGEVEALANSDIQAALEAVLEEKCNAASEKKRAVLEKAYSAAMSLASRAATLRALSAAWGIAFDKERVARGIDKGDGPQSLGEYLDSMNPPGYRWVPET